MGLEAFNSHKKDFKKYDRPEDGLQTPEEVAIDRRTRAFVAEGKVGEMLALKATLQVLREKRLIEDGLALPLRQFESTYQKLLDNPRDLAHAVIGVSLNNVDTISEEDLLKQRDEYLRNVAKPELIDHVDESLVEVRKYKERQNSAALDFVIRALEGIKEEVKKDNWRAVITWEHTLHGYTAGMRDLLGFTLGIQMEDDYVKHKYGLETSR